MGKCLTSVVGQKFGHLTVIGQELRPYKNERRTYCVCRCDCGNEVNVRADSLKSGDTKSCGCLRRCGGRRLDSMVGQRFGRLVVIDQELRSYKDHRRTYCLCQCDCGNETGVWADNLKRGHTKSCGCLHKGHGHATGRPSPTYQTWKGMLERCNNPNNVKYRYYGGRGVSVCERWRSFKNFLEDMGERPEDRTLDRIDPDGNYEPENCRWATAMEQAQNTRRNKK